MAQEVSATEARIRFGELMRRAVEDKEVIIVERGGKPCVVVLSVEEYRRLKERGARADWEETLEEIRQVASRIQARRGGRPLLPLEEVIAEVREERGVLKQHKPT